MPTSLQALGAHSKKLTVELDDCGTGCCSGIARASTQVFSLNFKNTFSFFFKNHLSVLICSHSRMRTLEADKMALKNVIMNSEKEEKSKVDVIEVMFEQHVHL